MIGVRQVNHTHATFRLQKVLLISIDVDFGRGVELLDGPAFLGVLWLIPIVDTQRAEQREYGHTDSRIIARQGSLADRIVDSVGSIVTTHCTVGILVET